ncbi:MAG: DUF4367 domain-containing protein [Methanoregula sp.]
MSRVTCLQGVAIVVVLLFVAMAGCLEQGTPPPAVSPAHISTPVLLVPTHPPMPYIFSSLLSIQKDRAPEITLALPAYLPDGFIFNHGTEARTSYEWPEHEGAYSFTYNRGQDEWLTLKEQSRNSTSCNDGPEYRAVVAGTALAAIGGAGELWWGRDGLCYNLSGTVSRDELEKVAASVQRMPYREGVTPPFEYQPPENPLIRNITVNRSSTEKNVTITVEYLDCTAKKCRAVIRLGIPSPPMDIVPPPGGRSPPVSPDPHAEWRVDGGRPLLKMSSIGYRPEGESTLISWNLEPLPEDSRELAVNFTRVKGISGPWLISIPLHDSSDIGHPAASHTEESS